jgi:hypothetical protein
MKVWRMRGEQRHRGGSVVHVCNKYGWLSSPWVEGRHWNLMGGCEPLTVERKEYVCWLVLCYIVLTSFDRLCRLVDDAALRSVEIWDRWSKMV